MQFLCFNFKKKKKKAKAHSENVREKFSEDIINF